MNTRIRAIFALFLVSLFFIALIPDEASAFPYRIKGYLKDGEGNPIPNGNVSITGETYDIAAQNYVEINIWLITDNTGYYEQALAYNEPGGFDDGATVIISYNPSSGDEGVSQSLTFSGFSSWVNLTYKEKVNVIDTLFSPIGIVSIVIIVSICFIGYYIYKSSDTRDNMNGEEKDRPKRVERRRKR